MPTGTLLNVALPLEFVVADRLTLFPVVLVPESLKVKPERVP